MPFAETPHGRIHVESHGQGPPLIVAPSFGTTTRNYRGLLPNLTETHRVLLYDIPGMGRSDDYLGDIRLELMADDVVRVLDYFGVDRASVLGTSMGAMIAQHFAVGYRDRLDRLILVTPRARRTPYGEGIDRVLADLFSACQPGRFVQHLLYLALGPDFVNKHPWVVEQMMGGMAISERDAETMARLIRDGGAFDGVPGLAGMDAPTLIVSGALDVLAPPSHGRILHAELPNSQLIVQEGVAHNPFVERPAETFTAVRAFMADGVVPPATGKTPTQPDSGADRQ